MHSFVKFTPIAAALLLATTGLASAQSMAKVGMDLTGLHQVDDDDDNSAMWNDLSMDKLDDMEIVNEAGEKIGEVDEILADGDGNLLAAIIEVGGFLGIGEKEVVISLDHFQLQDDKLVTPMTKEQLEALPEWED